MKDVRYRRRDERCFSPVEVLVATVILAVGFLSLIQMTVIAPTVGADDCIGRPGPRSSWSC